MGRHGELSFARLDVMHFPSGLHISDGFNGIDIEVKERPSPRGRLTTSLRMENVTLFEMGGQPGIRGGVD